MARWDPWRGCHRCSEGCRFCYIHKGDARRGVDTNRIVKNDNAARLTARKRNGEYRMPAGLVYLCFASDFLLEDADPWRDECWSVIRERSDCTFLFLTKRIERFMTCIPPDWGDGYDNVVVCCTIENQESADRRLPVFQRLPIRHRQITAQPLLEAVELERYLDGMEAVVVGGESDPNARPLDYAWVLSIRAQCVRRGAPFRFRQCGTHFIRDGRTYTLQVRDLCSQARKAGIDYL